MQYCDLQMARISFVVIGKYFVRLQDIKIFTMQKSNSKILSKEAAE